MIKIVILGEIGSGKTFVSKLFGFPVFSADFEVIKIYKKDKKCFKILKKKFPKHKLKFPIKKDLLIKIILENLKNLKIINNIVHPIVREKMQKFLIRNKNKKAIVLDVPLYLENKLYKKDDILVFIKSNKSQIKKKLKLRKNVNTKILKTLENTQISSKIKQKKSNFIIKNNFKKINVKKSVKIIKNKIFKNERNNPRY